MRCVNVVGITCWLGGVAWGVCPVGGACPPLLSTTGMLGDVVLWWGLNESCQSTAFLFNTHTLLIPPQPVQRGTHANKGRTDQYNLLIHNHSDTLSRRLSRRIYYSNGCSQQVFLPILFNELKRYKTVWVCSTVLKSPHRPKVSMT